MTEPASGRPIRVALTGGIGSGKSTVAAALEAHGAVLVDADRIARDIVEPGMPALAEIAQRFGPDVIQADGTLDRAALASVVFGDQQALADLNAITHPRIAARSQELIDAAPDDAVVVYDMPLLVEQGLHEGWDAVIVVETPLDVRVERLIHDRGMTQQDVNARIASQATDDERRAVADHVLRNDGSRDDLLRQVDVLWAAISER